MIEALVAFLLGFGLAIVLNRVRWELFPVSGGAPFLSWMGEPGTTLTSSEHFDRYLEATSRSVPPIDVPCEHCGAPPGTPCTAVSTIARVSVAPVDVPCEHCGAPPGTTCEHDNGADWNGDAPATFGVICVSCNRVFAERRPTLPPRCPECRRTIAPDFPYEGD